MLAVGAYLKYLRVSKGYTQDEVGEAIHVSGRTVRRWEYGKNEPSLSDLAAAARFLRGSFARIIEFLLTDAGAREGHQAAIIDERYGVTPEADERELILLVARLSGQRRQLALSLIRQLEEDSEHDR